MPCKASTIKSNGGSLQPSPGFVIFLSLEMKRAKYEYLESTEDSLQPSPGFILQNVLKGTGDSFKLPPGSIIVASAEVVSSILTKVGFVFFLS